MSAEGKLFAIANDATLSAAIRACRQKLVYIAPGVSVPIVEAIDALFGRADPPAVTVIIDTDPEVCRLGYGTEEGLKLLQKIAATRQLPLRCQPGVRLGVLISDEQMWVYTPTPLLIEAGAQRSDQPNAMLLGNAQTLQAVAKACAADGYDNKDVPLPDQAEIGRSPASPAAIQHALKELERQPPKPFDLARIERVYSSKLQYVELEVTGYRLTARRVQVPNDLLIGNDRTLEARLHNSFALLEGKEALVVEIPDADPKTNEKREEAGQPLLVKYSEQQIEAERKALMKDFLTPITGYGQLISRARRTAFDTRVQWFKDRIVAYKAAVDERLNEAVHKSVDELVEALLPTVRRSPPDRLLKNCLWDSPTDDDLRTALKNELHAAFNTGERFFQPMVKVVFKDLTYETTQDEAFRKQIESTFKIKADEFFNEFDAAPELIS